MIQRISEDVDVTFRKIPLEVNWRGRNYQIIKLGLHHTYRTGRVVFHVFSVESATLFFRLVLNTENLLWKVEEITDDAF